MTNSDDLKSHIAGVFSRASSVYDRLGTLFAHFGSRLVEFARVPAGAQVLDVACGSGAVLVPASAAVSAAGHVTGVDISEGMIERVRAEVEGRGLSNVSVLRMDAEHLAFADATFDFILCGMGLFFLPNIDQALLGFCRVLKPGGHIAASTERSVPDARTKRWQDLRDAYKRDLSAAPSRPRLAMSSDSECRETLSRAGFVDIEVSEQQAVHYLKDEDDWWQTEWSVYRRDFLERLDARAVEDFKRRAFELLQSEKTEKGIPRTWHILFSRARKA